MNGDDENGEEENGDTVSGAEEDIETSLALDSNGYHSISYTYYDDSRLDEDLRYAWFAP